MSPLALASLIGAAVVMVVALVYQRRDLVPGYGGTMGGEMTAGLLWMLAALLVALAALDLMPWYFTPLVWGAVVGLSFPIRIWVARIAKPPVR